MLPRKPYGRRGARREEAQNSQTGANRRGAHARNLVWHEEQRQRRSAPNPAPRRLCAKPRTDGEISVSAAAPSAI